MEWLAFLAGVAVGLASMFLFAWWLGSADSSELSKAAADAERIGVGIVVRDQGRTVRVDPRSYEVRIKGDFTREIRP